MRKNSLMLFAMCATLLWIGAAHAGFLERPPLSCAQRQARAVEGLDELLNLGQRLCTADLNRYGCDANVCLPEAFPATGQTTSYVAGDDGDIKAGGPLSYTDNGDGTITDHNTKLMWEKKDESGGLHDVGNQYPWQGICSTSSDTCGTDADCGAGGGTCTPAGGAIYTIFQWVAALNAEKFAGYSDWRIPNVKELQSIVDYGTSYPPVVATAFNASCSSGCSVTTCSCTQSGLYWSASSFAGTPVESAWLVDFNGGFVDVDIKTFTFPVRAVRGGL